jgi:Fur family zinc uptake transcriptional regulator
MKCNNMTSDSRKEHTADLVSFIDHNHSACMSDALLAAETLCSKEGHRFTPVRRKVLEILLQEHRALGAYAILDRLREEGFGSQPPVAYRALDFLVTHNLAHKIERLNAFIACSHPNHAHTPAFMICRLCDSVAETQSSPERGVLGDAARATGFKIERAVVEAEGVCPACTDMADA